MIAIQTYDRFDDPIYIDENMSFTYYLTYAKKFKDEKEANEYLKKNYKYLYKNREEKVKYYNV